MLSFVHLVRFAGARPGLLCDCPLLDARKVLSLAHSRGASRLAQLTNRDVQPYRLFPTSASSEASLPFLSTDGSSNSGKAAGGKKRGRPPKPSHNGSASIAASTSTSSSSSFSTSSAAEEAWLDAPFEGVLFVTYATVARSTRSSSASATERLENELLLAVLQRKSDEYLADIQLRLDASYAAKDWTDITHDGRPPRKSALQQIAEWFSLEGEGGECWVFYAT